MYKSVSILSALIRQFCLPNPYEIYFNSSAYADVFNIIIGGAILHLFSFFLTSSIYEKGRHPSWIGSALYCINYIGNTYLIQYLCNTFSNLQIQNIIIFAFIANVVLFMLFRGIKNKISYSSVFV